jgi:hypothetical protein
VAKRLLLALVLAAAVVAAVWYWRGGGESTAPSGTTSTTAAATIPVQDYYYLGAALVPVVVQVPKTEGVATAALRALVAGPAPGYQTALPRGVKVVRLAIAGGVATVKLSEPVVRRAQAQVVYTLSQFPTVRRVVLGAGSPATRKDYVDLTQAAPIFVSIPIDGATVSSPLRVAGTASIFEATLALEIRSGGKLVRTESITASAGAPQRGNWSTTLELPPGSYTLSFFEPSAKDGSHLHTTSVRIRVHP